MHLQTRTIVGTLPGPRVLITAGVHGDEYEPMAAVRRLASALEPARLQGQVTLVPVVNEPAFRLGRRCAEDGLDLARTCPGRADGTATEAIAAAVSELIRDSDFLIDLHTGGGKYTLAPLAGYMLHQVPTVLETQRRMAIAFGFPLVWGTDPTPSGRTLSVARDANIPAIYTESGGGPFDPSGVTVLVNGCLNVLAELGLIERPTPTRNDPPLIVEDARAGSGYLQGCHPSPRDGFFEPVTELQLGQTVRHGDLLGRVCDALGDWEASVQAQVSGLLIGLHTQASVRKGDGLAIVVEHTPEKRGAS